MVPTTPKVPIHSWLVELPLQTPPARRVETKEGRKGQKEQEQGEGRSNRKEHGEDRLPQMEEKRASKKRKKEPKHQRPNGTRPSPKSKGFLSLALLRKALSRPSSYPFQGLFFACGGSKRNKKHCCWQKSTKARHTKRDSATQTNF